MPETADDPSQSTILQRNPCYVVGRQSRIWIILTSNAASVNEFFASQLAWLFSVIRWCCRGAHYRSPTSEKLSYNLICELRYIITGVQIPSIAHSLLQLSEPCFHGCIGLWCFVRYDGTDGTAVVVSSDKRTTKNRNEHRSGHLIR